MTKGDAGRVALAMLDAGLVRSNGPDAVDRIARKLTGADLEILGLRLVRAMELEARHAAIAAGCTDPRPGVQARAVARYEAAMAATAAVLEEMRAAGPGGARS